MASLVPTSRLSSVDLPAFGRPINETNPLFILSGAPPHTPARLLAWAPRPAPLPRRRAVRASRSPPHTPARLLAGAPRPAPLPRRRAVRASRSPPHTPARLPAGAPRPAPLPRRRAVRASRSSPPTPAGSNANSVGPRAARSSSGRLLDLLRSLLPRNADLCHPSAFGIEDFYRQAIDIESFAHCRT